MLTPILSIDFDFWIPVRLDLQPRFAERGGDTDLAQWVYRAVEAAKQDIDLPRQITVGTAESPSPEKLAEWLAPRHIELAPEGVGVMDQHQHAFNHFADLRDNWLVHVDAHHDMGYGAHGTPLHCGNWVERLVEQGSLKRITLIYPLWRRAKNYFNSLETEAHIRRKQWLRKLDVEVKFGLGDMPSRLRFARTAICRSGAWTPPWLDAAFNDMVKRLVCNPARTYESTPIRSLDWAACQHAARLAQRREHSHIRLQAAVVAVKWPISLRSRAEISKPGLKPHTR